MNVLIVRLDSAGDVLLAGPAIRAAAGQGHRVTVLAGPRGRAAAGLLPGVGDVVVWECPWVDPEPGAVGRADVLRTADVIAALGIERAVILTSFHQSPLPTALLLRLAGVPHLTAASEDYPGSLLDVRHILPDNGLHEVERMLSVAAAAGFPPPPDRRLRLRAPLPDVGGLLGGAPASSYLVLHPGASVPARAPSAQRAAEYARTLAADGWPVVVTGAAAERGRTRQVAGEHALDLGGQTGLAELAAVIAGAAAVITGNTGPAHLAAATGTPVVSLFAPTVPLERWRPWQVPHVVLGRPDAPCAGSRARICPVPGHPCLSSVTGAEVAAAVRRLADNPKREVHA